VRRRIAFSMRRVWLVGLVALTGVLLVAQEKSGGGNASPAEIDQLLMALTDINWFHNVRPLNLTAEQVDRLLAAHEKAFKRLEEMVQQEAKELRNRKDEILRVREDASRGKSVPKEFIEAMRQLEQEFIRRRQEFRARIIREIATELKPRFTDEQMDYMVKRSQEVLQASKVNTEKLERDQLFMFFVEHVFLNERTPTLLKEWKQKNLTR
jgi:type II secretory pathway predicted ATPase ExeA